MIGLLICLIFIWSTAAKDTSAIDALENIPDKYPASEIWVTVNKNPLDARGRRRNTCRRELEGKCVRRKRRCPSSLPLETSHGKPYCSRRKRCCYPDPDTSCRFKSLQERKEFLKLWPGRCGGEGDDCELDWSNGSPNNPPFIMYSTGEILLPQGVKGNAKINIDSGKKVIFSCSLTELENFPDTHIEGVCEKGELKVNGEKKTLSDMGCQAKIRPSVQEKKSSIIQDVEQEKCGGKEDGLKWEIGFETYWESKYFYPMIEVCFDKEKLTTLSAMNYIHGKNLKAKDNKINDPPWAKAQFTIDMDKIYTEEMEKKLFEQDLGGILQIDFEANKKFSKGHLSPQSDFVTKSGQISSFYYLNALPQWQIYNGGSWALLEGYIEDLAKANDALLETYTGGSGIMKTPKENKDIFLAQSLDNKPEKVPIPNLFWKVVTVSDKEGKILKAVAFVTNNNPLEGKGKPEMPCTDICTELKDWITEKQLKNLRKEELGYTYCCKVDDLKTEDFPNLPKINKDVPLLTDLK